MNSFLSIYLFYFIIVYFGNFRGGKNRGSMYLVHISVDLVHRAGPWTRACFVLSLVKQPLHSMSEDAHVKRWTKMSPMRVTLKAGAMWLDEVLKVNDSLVCHFISKGVNISGLSWLQIWGFGFLKSFCCLHLSIGLPNSRAKELQERLKRGKTYLKTYIWMLCCVALGTQIVEQRINSEVNYSAT